MHTSAVRRLTGNEHLTSAFATEWPTYDLDERTRALLSYATKLTEAPSQIEDADIEALRAAGWGERGVWGGHCPDRLLQLLGQDGVGVRAASRRGAGRRTAEGG